MLDALHSDRIRPSLARKVNCRRRCNIFAPRGHAGAPLIHACRVVLKTVGMNKLSLQKNTPDIDIVPGVDVMMPEMTVRNIRQAQYSAALPHDRARLKLAVQ